jgi:hypothetical protein
MILTIFNSSTGVRLISRRSAQALSFEIQRSIGQLVEDIIELGLPQFLQEQQTVTYKLSLNRIIIKKRKTSEPKPKPFEGATEKKRKFERKKTRYKSSQF